MLAARVDSQPGTRRRWKALAALTVAALLLHAGLLGGLPLAWPGRDAALLPGPAVQVRMLDPAPAVHAVPAEQERATPKSVVAATPVARQPRVATRPPSRPAAGLVGEPPREVAKAIETPPPDVPVVPAALGPNEDSALVHRSDPPPAASAARPGGEGEIPVYRTRVPPPLTLRYEVRRGALRGSGELQWHPVGEHYQMQLELHVGGFRILSQTSEGGFDDAGLAPRRFTDQRLRRGQRAANFRRDAGKITFSGPSAEYPLLLGSQDRLSWMIQLAAVVAAEPERLGDGGKIAMQVVGARADAGVWVFRYLHHETVQTEAGPVQAAKFVREPRAAYDTQIEVWLDPLRHHLPVRATLRNGLDGEALDLLLQDMIPTPTPP